MNNIQDDYEQLYKEYTVFHSGHMIGAEGKTTGYFYMLAANENQSGVARVSVAQQVTDPGVYISPQCFFYWDPDDYEDLRQGAGGERTLKLRMRSVVMCNGSTAPGQSFTFGIRPIQSLGGGSSSVGRAYTMPLTNFSGFTTTHTTPAANSTTVQTVEMADATLLPTDTYAICWNNAVSLAGASQCDLRVDLALKIE